MTNIQLDLLYAIEWLIDTYTPQTTVKHAIEQGRQHHQNKERASNKST